MPNFDSIPVEFAHEIWIIKHGADYSQCCEDNKEVIKVGPEPEDADEE